MLELLAYAPGERETSQANFDTLQSQDERTGPVKNV
jgi:hypothetical protein